MARYLLLHAFPFDGSMWDGVAGRLRAEGHVVMAPHLAGGGSAYPDIDVLVDAALDVLGGRPAIVVGCSMGGYVALGIVRRRPDLVAALVLVDTKATADGDAARAHRARVAETAETGGDWSAGMIDGLLGATTRQHNSSVVRQVEATLAAAPREHVAWLQRAMATRPDARGALAMLTTPIVVVVGEEDTMSPLAEQHLITDAAPHADLVKVSRAGHLTPLEAPDAVADALLRMAAQS